MDNTITLQNISRQQLKNLKTKFQTDFTGMDLVEEIGQEDSFTIQGQGIVAHATYVPFNDDEGNLIIEITKRPAFTPVWLVEQEIKEAMK